MIVLIDGKEIKVGNDVKIIYDTGDEDYGKQELHVTATHEGIIKDVIEGDGYVVATASATAHEIVDEMYEDVD